MKSGHRLWSASLAALIAGLGLALLAGSPFADAKPAKGTAAPPAAAAPVPGPKASSSKVPDRLCATCHQGVNLDGAPHHVLTKTMPGQTCVVCHGRPNGHLDDPWQHPMNKVETPAEKAARCLSCHKSGPAHVVRWSKTSFAKEGKTCADCHKVHGATGPGMKFTGDAKGYVGSATCRMCHRPIFDTFGESFHAGVLGKPGGGCETCHGPGLAHVNGALAFSEGKGPANIAKKPPQKNCLTCHSAIPDQHARTNFVYREKRPACTVCHRVHVDRNDPLWSDKGMPPSAKQKVGNAACARCHVTAIESAKKSVHAEVVKEKGCEVCHGPAKAHVLSGGRPRLIRDPLFMPPKAVSALCLTCHSAKPEHAREWKGGPLAAQGLSCLTCHQAHGGKDVQGHPRLRKGTPVVAGKTVGTMTCRICHADAHPGIERSPHAALVADPKAAGCEACHGPGSEHVMKGGDPKAIRNPARMTKSERTAFCLSCHGRSKPFRSWEHGAHERAGLTCETCHEPLAPVDRSGKKKEPQLCFACHKEVKAQFGLPNHHPLARGAVTCSDCHEIHGEPPGDLDVNLRRERCYKCHKDKEGPFLFEHEADRVDGCTVCHQPHGSVNRRLLTHRRVSDLCLSCHVPPASHSLAAGSPFRHCLNCHGSIHGSYVDKLFFR